MDLADSVLPSAKYSEMDFSISFSFFFFSRYHPFFIFISTDLCNLKSLLPISLSMNNYTTTNIGKSTKSTHCTDERSKFVHIYWKVIKDVEASKDLFHQLQPNYS